jgi:hypothetical protein
MGIVIKMAKIKVNLTKIEAWIDGKNKGTHQSKHVKDRNSDGRHGGGNH